jgi:hypothetical protein
VNGFSSTSDLKDRKTQDVTEGWWGGCLPLVVFLTLSCPLAAKCDLSNFNALYLKKFSRSPMLDVWNHSCKSWERFLKIKTIGKSLLEIQYQEVKSSCPF